MFKFFKKLKSINKKKGIALVIAVTTMTLLLSLSLSISNIVLRQIKIANINNSSKPTFFAADSAIECIFYYDTKYIASTTDPVADENLEFTTSIFGDSGIEKITNNVKCGTAVLPISKSKVVDSDVVVSNLDINYGPYCAKVIVTKTDTGTEIMSRGYNTVFDAENGCDLTNLSSKRIVERGLYIKY